MPGRNQANDPRHTCKQSTRFGFFFSFSAVSVDNEVSGWLELNSGLLIVKLIIQFTNTAKA